jgi:hypothetical protein
MLLLLRRRNALMLVPVKVVEVGVVGVIGVGLCHRLIKAVQGAGRRHVRERVRACWWEGETRSAKDTSSRKADEDDSPGSGLLLCIIANATHHKSTDALANRVKKICTNKKSYIFLHPIPQRSEQPHRFIYSPKLSENEHASGRDSLLHRIFRYTKGENANR